jgi:hypothetical protein
LGQYYVGGLGVLDGGSEFLELVGSGLDFGCKLGFGG